MISLNDSETGISVQMALGGRKWATYSKKCEGVIFRSTTKHSKEMSH